MAIVLSRRTVCGGAAALALAPLACSPKSSSTSPPKGSPVMDLGTFSISLAVKDLAASRSFYEALGFAALPAMGEGPVAAAYGKSWLILAQGTTKIGLFSGSFDKNTLTFNPTDVRAVQRSLKSKGITLALEADETTTGPAACLAVDPDGNPVLFDQH